jgi:hypothetical protein
MMVITNENMLRVCIQDAQGASVLLTQAIVGIGTCAVPQSPREAQVFRLLRANLEAINLLLSTFEWTAHEFVQSWPTI